MLFDEINSLLKSEYKLGNKIGILEFADEQYTEAIKNLKLSDLINSNNEIYESGIDNNLYKILLDVQTKHIIKTINNIIYTDEHKKLLEQLSKTESSGQIQELENKLKLLEEKHKLTITNLTTNLEKLEQVGGNYEYQNKLLKYLLKYNYLFNNFN